MGFGKTLMALVSMAVFALVGTERAHAEEENGDAEQAPIETAPEETGSEAADPQEDSEAEEEGTGQMGRRVLHMGPQNVTGQLARTGVIQLVRRTPRPLQELVSLRTTFRDRIVNQVYRSNDQP